MASAAVAIELGGAAEFGGDDDEGFIEELLLFKVVHEGGDAVVEVADEFVLFELALAVGVPAGAIEEAGVVGEFDEADAILDEASGEKAALAKFRLVAIAEGVGF